MTDHRDRLIAQKVQRGTFRALVDAKCIECIYEVGAEGNWRKQVTDCTSPQCPLFSKRPQTKGYNNDTGI